MNDIFKNPSHTARLGYNGFNMEQKIDFTAAPCMLLPIYYDIALFGDKMRLQCNVKLRTQPLEAAAEFNAQVRIDWFAVPIRLLYKFFGDQYYNIQDFGTNFVNINNYNKTDVLPIISISDTMSSIMTSYPEPGTEDTLYPFYHYLYSDEDTTGIYISHANDSFRLMDCLGIPISEFNGPQPYLPTINAFIPAAYQKIYYDFYRLTDREVNDPSFYNLDACINNRQVNDSQAVNLFRLHYAPWSKDYFTNVFPSPLQGQGSIDSFGSQIQQFNSWLSGGNSFIVGGSPYSSPSYPNGGSVNQDNLNPTTVRVDGSTASLSSISSNTNISFNPANIRGMFAVEKALEITRRSAKHYDAQTLAHWGVKLPDSLSGECMYLGSQMQPFIVGDIVSTSASGDEPLGTIAGKGYSSYKDERSNNPVITFEAKEPSVVMAIFSVMPELRYTQRGYDRLLSWNYVHDWPHPESDNLGMQPLFWYELWAKNTTDAEVSPTSIFDWSYGYSEIKAKHNRVIGNVHKDGTLSSWVPQVDFYRNMYTNYHHQAFFYGDPMWLNDSLSYKYYYHNVKDKTGYIGINYAKLYSRDPFIISADFNCTKSSKLSKYSLVNL